MELPDDVLTLYTAEIESHDGRASVDVPERELTVGDLAVGESYRVAILPGRATNEEEADDATTNEVGQRQQQRGRTPSRSRTRENGEPPVAAGEICEVEIEDVGDQGDGIARIGPGYVVFVPNTTVGDRVTAEITEARENFAFAEVVEGEPLSN